MEEYVKTGEDKKYEYYRNDSEVLSGDGEEQPYEEILGKRNEFNVKIADNIIVIKKPSLNKIMIMSDSMPEEQILFSLYKTVEHGQSLDQRRNQANNLDSLRNSKPVAFPNMTSSGADDPLSGQMAINNNINVNPNANVNVINIPTNEGSDNEEVRFNKAANANDVVIVGLPPQAVRTKWFYLLLCLVGIGFVILFIASILSDSIGFLFNTLCLCLVGVFLIFTGLFGFLKINNKVFDNNALKLCTIICILLGLLGAVIIFLNAITKVLFIPSLILGILSAFFSLLCIIWTSQLRKIQEQSKIKQMELLV